MFRVAVLFACLAVCHSHAVLPVVPAAHAIHTAPLVVPYPLEHGFAGHGLSGAHGVYGGLHGGHSVHGGLYAKPLVHHLLKRSPHIVSPYAHAVAPLAVAHVAPVAVSHQSRVDVHSSPALIAPVLPIVKPVVAPVFAAPLLHKSFIASPYYGAGHGHYGGVYPHY